jgi:hypothetical protein
MKKAIRIVLVALIVLLIALVFFTSHLVKNTINRVGPTLLGVPVSVAHVDISLIQGRVRLGDLVIGNPEGFATDSLFAMGGLNVDLSMASLFTDTIVVREIVVTAPVVTYEQKLTGSNVGALQKQLAGEAKEPAADEAPAAEPDPAAGEAAAAPGKKVVIERFLLADGTVKVSLPGMMGTAVPIPLPAVELKDIGKEEEGGKGASLIDVIGKVLGAVFKAVIEVVASSGQLLGDGVKLLGDGAMAAGGLAVDGVTAVGGAAVDGVSAVGGAAVDGVSAVGGAAVDGVSAVGKGVAGAVGGVVNLFGGGENESDKETSAE